MVIYLLRVLTITDTGDSTLQRRASARETSEAAVAALALSTKLYIYMYI
jgi:hypothetical protein